MHSFQRLFCCACPIFNILPFAHPTSCAIPPFNGLFVVRRAFSTCFVTRSFVVAELLVPSCCWGEGADASALLLLVVSVLLIEMLQNATNIKQDEQHYVCFGPKAPTKAEQVDHARG